MPKRKISFTFATHTEGHHRPDSEGEFCRSQWFFPETLSAIPEHQAMFAHVRREAQRLVGEDSFIEAYPHYISLWWRSTKMSNKKHNATKGALDDVVHGALDSCFESHLRTFAHMTGMLESLQEREVREIMRSQGVRVFN